MKQLIEKTILLLICTSLVSCFTDFKSNNLSFNSEQWKNGDLRVRGQMSKDIEKSKILEGKTKSQAKFLLGNPEHINENPKVETENWSYKTDKGLKLGNGVWINWFNVEFNKDGTVVKTFTTD